MKCVFLAILSLAVMAKALEERESEQGILQRSPPSIAQESGQIRLPLASKDKQEGRVSRSVMDGKRRYGGVRVQVQIQQATQQIEELPKAQEQRDFNINEIKLINSGYTPPTCEDIIHSSQCVKEAEKDESILFQREKAICERLYPNLRTYDCIPKHNRRLMLEVENKQFWVERRRRIRERKVYKEKCVLTYY